MAIDEKLRDQWLKFILRGTWMFGPNFEPIRPVDVEIFHWNSEDFYLLVVLQEKSGDRQSH